MIRLNIDERSGLHSLIREKILQGNFSRNAYDISIVLAYFGRTLKRNKGIGKEDMDVFCHVMKDLKHMEFSQLRSNHHGYIVDGLKDGMSLLKDDEVRLKQI